MCDALHAAVHFIDQSFHMSSPLSKAFICTKAAFNQGQTERMCSHDHWSHIMCAWSEVERELSSDPQRQT